MDSPYKFLDFYGIDDQDIFFGRERETNILVADVVVNRLVVLFARTGTGKTSLINAGVRPRLEARDFRTFYVRVEQDPAEAARDVLRKEDLLKETEEETSLSTQLGSVVESLNKPIVLFFDQFEEFFIQIGDKQTRREFISDISEVYRNVESGVHLVFSMREEYFHEMDEFRSEIPSIFHKNSNLRLLPLDEDQARVAIINPAAARGVEVENSLADEIIKDLKQEKDSIRPPSLQIICDTLWRKENRVDNRITPKDYEELGRGESILDQRLAQDIEEAADTNLLSLMQRLIPELQTGEGTKYPRVFLDLITTLDTKDEILRELISRLKGVKIIKEITVSGAYGIEWASDYLAERTELLMDIVNVIELRRLLQKAMEKATARHDTLEGAQPDRDAENSDLVDGDTSNNWHLSADEFEQFSQSITSLKNLQANEIEFLFDTALFYQRHMKRWFDLVSRTNATALDFLHKKMHDKEAIASLRVGAINLLAELGSGQALSLLEEALDEPDLALEAVEILINVPGNQATQLLAKSLERDDLWEAVVISLTRAGTQRAVLLLKPLLQQETKFFQAFNALVRLARSSSPVGSNAEKTLEAAIPILVGLLDEEEKFFPALGALERLTKYTGQVGSMAEKTLESAIPILEGLLKNEPNSISALGALERLTKFRDPLGSMAQNAFMQSKTSPTRQPEPAERKLSERIKDLFVNNRLEKKAPARLLAKESATQIDLFMRDIMPYINQGIVTPILSNSFRIEQIFRNEKKLTEASKYANEDWTVNEQLTKTWATLINYPGADDHNLAQVAQYYSVEQRDSRLARAKYINFLKEILLTLSEQDETYKEQASELKRKAAEIRFSEVVQWLDYPRFPQATDDPLRLLARLPLPIYITTGYFDFLERALEAEGKSPRTQICFWSGARSRVKTEHLPDPDFQPTPSNPVVYHLYGLEDYPQTLVLCEDDFMNFLISVAEDTNTQNPIVPLRLREGLAESQLLLLGYDVRDWDFRVLFRSILKFRNSEFSPRGLIQLKPGVKQSGNIEQSEEYLGQYFDTKHFGVEWINTEKFIQNLWNEWDKYRMGRS